MTRLHVERDRVIDAPPETIYRLLADYRTTHPTILPPQFTRLDVEQGGVGAGTVFRAEMSVMGSHRSYRMEVSEPEPGRVLAETDLDTDLVTTFTLEPLDDTMRTRLTIATDWQPASGLAGMLERLTTPSIMGRMYEDELGRIAAAVVPGKG